MFGFIKRLLGMAGEKPAHNAVTPPSTSGTAALPSAPSAPVRKAPAVVLRRDEILDGKTRIAGYRFTVRRPDSGLLAEPWASVEALAANQVASFAERRLALIPLAPEDWAREDCRALIGPNTVFVLMLPESDAGIAAWCEAAAAIRQAGAKVALAGGGGSGQQQAALPHADYLLLDFPDFSLPSLEQMLKTLRDEKPGLAFIADNVGRWSEYRYCVSRGIAYCLGAFATAQDDAQEAREIGQSRLVLIEMLNQLRKEAELSDIAQTAKRDPGVIVKVIAMANSPALGLSQAVTSIDQAIMVLGREQLYRWLSIGMFRAGASSPRDEVLLEIALARGRFLEVLGQEKHGKLECDELFLLGLLSLLDTLLGLPMNEVIAKINLSPVLMEALLSSGGPLARYLMLAIAVEKGHVQNVTRLAEQLGYALESIEAASTEAVAWAEDAVNLTK
ncbi:MAG: hypothetical protein H6R14_676 [Proteobacteria bacterium]|nr:hypothetical protein [Pseudomonadota bacterium]